MANKNGALTIKDVLAFCLKEYQKGHGDYAVFVTDDEEANGYHALWFNGQEAADYKPEDREYLEHSNHDICILDNKDEAVYIG